MLLNSVYTGASENKNVIVFRAGLLSSSEQYNITIHAFFVVVVVVIVIVAFIIIFIITFVPLYAYTTRSNCDDRPRDRAFCVFIS